MKQSGPSRKFDRIELRVKAEAGDADAQYRLGVTYAEIDLAQAYKWYRLAGCTEALEELAAKMTPEQLSRAQALASSWKPTVLNHDHILAHTHCSGHRNELEKSDLCGCFYCLAIFPPSEITEWIDGGQTALCPKCPVDSVIGSASGYPITIDFLRRMHDYWFA